MKIVTVKYTVLNLRDGGEQLKKNKKIPIYISHRAYAEMVFYAEKAGDYEVVGLLLGNLKNNMISIEETVLLEQEVTRGTAEINDEAIAKWLADNPEKSDLVVGWWHSHGTMSPHLSYRDIDTSEKVSFGGKLAIAIVVNKYGEICAKAFAKLPYIEESVELDCTIKIKLKLSEEEKKLLSEEFEQKVKKREYYYMSTYSGWKTGTNNRLDDDWYEYYKYY